MNSIRRVLFLKRGQKAKGKSLKLGCILFITMFLFCVIGTIFLPLQVEIKEKELKDIPPSLPYQIPDIDTSQLKGITSQISCSIALMSDGTLTQWGQCEKIPENVKGKEIIQVAAGYAHVIALDKEGNVYGWGENTHKEIEQLAQYKNIKEIQAHDGVSAFITHDKEVILIGNTSLYEDIPQELQGHIKDMALGIHHIAIVSDEDNITILGNQGSELAHIPNITTKIQDIQLNHNEVMVLDEQGSIYTWGNNTTRPEMKTPIQQIAMSSYASYALSNGNIYGWGEGNHKELDIPQGMYTRMYADTYRMVGIQEDGTLKYWGQKNYVLGSDEAGRDILTRLVHGGLITMGIGIIACIIEGVLAIFVGILAGLCGGWIDQFLMRCAEIIASIPFLPLVITLAAYIPNELDTITRMVFIMILLGCLSWVPLARMIRAQVLIEKEKDYVWSAKIMGASKFHILRKEILPQVMNLCIVHITLSYADNMLIETSLSFLGFGVQAPYPSWGNMIEKAQHMYVMEHCWWQWILPALCILITLWSVNLIGEGMRRKYNPKEEV